MSSQTSWLPPRCAPDHPRRSRRPPDQTPRPEPPHCSGAWWRGLSPLRLRKRRRPARSPCRPRLCRPPATARWASRGAAGTAGSAGLQTSAASETRLRHWKKRNLCVGRSREAKHCSWSPELSGTVAWCQGGGAAEVEEAILLPLRVLVGVDSREHGKEVAFRSRGDRVRWRRGEGSPPRRGPAPTCRRMPACELALPTFLQVQRRKHVCPRDGSRCFGKES